MLCCKLLVPIFLLLNLTAYSQFGATPTPTPRPGSRQANLPGISADNDRYDRLRAIEMKTRRPLAEDHPLLDRKKGIYRNPSKDEVSILAVSAPLLNAHADLLKLPDTGIVKLNAETSCVTDLDVVIASEKCLPFKMPGSGTAYSFRTESYRIPRIADIILMDRIFRTGGVYQQVIIAEIGDIPMKDVTLGTKGMAYLLELKPASDGDEFMKYDAEITKGIQADGLLYRKGQPVNENSTYALRSIAYRGNFVRTIDGIQYDELEFDKRRDVIVAFRVVDIDDTGNVTILWKRLKDVEAPKLKVKK